jgi:DNA-binding GntR family transcriptional regulator
MTAATGPRPTARPGAPKLTGLARTSLREQALQSLRNALTSGDITPGTHLVETELSESLNISRGTLREALRQLQQEGLVEAGERGRLMARSISDRDVAHMFQVRAALEGLAVEVLCRLEDRTEVVAELTAALHAMEQSVTDIHELVETDLDFHRQLCLLTGNSSLVTSWDMIAGSIRMSIMFAGPERALSNMAVARHEQILRAVEAGSAEEARAILFDHMQGAINNTMQDPPDIRRRID